ncbi:hypothetical protein BJ166DRAFT_306665 [Pestalotiopsis sp. NC0098]|nr:hypothetical protein BJ166DRAFT_306665 [Pestalotiopsis sp. NC0098]
MRLSCFFVLALVGLTGNFCEIENRRRWGSFKREQWMTMHLWRKRSWWLPTVGQVPAYPYLVLSAHSVHCRLCENIAETKTFCWSAAV